MLVGRVINKVGLVKEQMMAPALQESTPLESTGRDMVASS